VTAIADGPALASVILPVRNAAATIGDQLAALAGQTYAGAWELVVADNGSADETAAVVEGWRDRLPVLKVVDASRRRGVAHARNVGLRAAAGEVLLICDGDDVVAPDWLEHMVAALEAHPLVTGFTDIVTLNRPEQYRWTGDEARAEAGVGYGFLPYASGGNLGMWREVFDLLAGFDEKLRRAEDVDFGWRACYAGIQVHFEPRAVIQRRLRERPSTVLLAGIRGGISEPGLYRRHRQRGMARESFAEVFGLYRWLARTSPAVVLGRDNRLRWAALAGMRLGRVVGSVRNRVLFL
jgi:glycosyltransferase involved in cell wall biosynthesis